MPAIATQLASIRQRMAQACQAAGRNAGSVRLLAVSKTRPAGDIRLAHDAGQIEFGENYVQEAEQKIAALADLPLSWHLIGPLQSNKTRFVAGHFHWVHSIDRFKIAERLSIQRPAHLPPLNICLQVNSDDEASKSGLTSAELPDLIKAILPLPNLCLRGLMCIPAPGNHQAFHTLAATFRQLQATIPGLDNKTPGKPHWDTLSMGMSEDLEAAIAAGSTLVRVGTAIFGVRPVMA